MKSNNKFQIKKGYPLLLGANAHEGGYNFAVEVPRGIRPSLVLYRRSDPKDIVEIPFPEDSATGNIHALFIKGFSPRDFDYNFKFDDRVVQDPNAYRLYGRDHFGRPCEDEALLRCGFLNDKAYNWQEDAYPDIPYSEMILYKLHVRGFTMESRVYPRKRGTFAGLAAMIPYLQELGVNAVELMPAYDFEECFRKPLQSGLVTSISDYDRINYWGYTKGFYFAPKLSYCSTKEPEKEFRDMVKAFHKASMEVFMEMYFPEDVAPFVALRAVQFWRLFYHVDGFHLMGDPAIIEIILKDRLLTDVKLIADPGIINHVAPMEPPKTRRFAETSSGFMHDMRRFLKSDEDVMNSVAYRLKHNPDDHSVINYMACQDGFTLMDSICYNYRHNEDNGQNNTDGSSYNFSWNCGEEGPSKKKQIKKLRMRQLKNAILMVMLNPGVPMIYAGDEFGNSQQGNNNAWCQDNSTGWVNWKELKRNKVLAAFVKECISFRKAHPVLHPGHAFENADRKKTGMPDFSLHGERAWFLNYENTSRLVGALYCGAYATRADGSEDDYLYVGYNFYWEERELALPRLPEGMVWRVIMDSADEKTQDFFAQKDEPHEKTIIAAPRSILILAAHMPDKTTPTKKRIHPEAKSDK